MNRFRRRDDAGTIRPRSGRPAPAPRARRSTFARLIGAVGMVSLTVALYWLLTDDGFRVTSASVHFEGLRHADEAIVREHLSGIEREPNVFRVRAADIVATVAQMPEVDAAAARVTLPADVSVELDEREPLFIWSNGQVAWLVDEEGMLFGPTGASAEDGGDAEAPTEAEAAMEAEAAIEAEATAADGDAGDEAAPTPDPLAAVADLGLPVIQDDRLPDEPPTVGSHLPASDLGIMRQLLALTPELLGSRSGALELRVDQALGYVLTSDRGWQAVFGHYSPNVQPAGHIPRQVQCLQALLAQEERRLVRVRLSLSETGCGTFSQRGRG
jgi:hypothetical protein